MSIKMNLWSLTLLPGEKYPMLIPRDFQITNCALGEELRNESGRSVVKVTHNPIPPSAFEDSDSEFDSEIDSELEDELRDEFEMEDDEDGEDDEEDDEDQEAPKKAKKVNGHIAGELVDEDDEDDDDEDEDDEDDEDDSEFSDEDEEALETNVMCSLIAGKVEQTTLNLTFIEGEVVMFEVTGENAVHLMGNYIDQAPDEEDDDSEYDSEFDDYSDIYGSEEDDSDLEDVDGPTIEEIDELPKALKAVAAEPKKAKAAAPVQAAPKAEKRKAEEAADVSMASTTDGLSKSQKKKLAKKQKTDGAAPAPVAEKKEAKPEVVSSKAQKTMHIPNPSALVSPSARNTANSQKVLPGGLIVEDSKVGDGPVAKKGKRLGMRYIGKLESGKQFDANTSGKPFSFVLGRGEVIKGWDQGLEGMAVGGERRLTIPAPLAYGSQKIPGIPKNSTLKFEVKLVSVA